MHAIKNLFLENSILFSQPPTLKPSVHVQFMIEVNALAPPTCTSCSHPTRVRIAAKVTGCVFATI